MWVPNRGRPPLVSDEVVLDAALAAFAASGYAAMSVRALNADLGLSHETISQRFGPKVDLFRAAVGRGVARLVADFDAELGDPVPTDDLERLRATVRAFMVVSARHPALGDLLHHEGIGPTERAVLVGESGFAERLASVVALLARLHAAGVIHETRIRDLWFLMQGAAAPMHFRALAAMFDPFDGPLVDDEFVERMTAAVMRSMGVDDARSRRPPPV